VVELEAENSPLRIGEMKEGVTLQDVGKGARTQAVELQKSVVVAEGRY